MTELSKKDQVQICKVVAQAVLADGQIADSERKLLDELMDRYALDDAERKDVLARNIDDDPTALAAGIEALDTKNALIAEVVMAIAADGALSKAERDLISEVATALGVAQDEVEAAIKAAL